MATDTNTPVASRRRFLAALPAAGTLALVSPIAVAAPAVRDPREVLRAYDEWLFRERRRVHAVLWPGQDPRETARFVSVSTLPDESNPAEGVPARAAAVLAAAGIDVGAL